jgi:hypothetical protein
VQERLVPVTNGAIPEAPEGGHSSQAGTLFEPAVAPADDEPREPDDAGPAVADGPVPGPAPEAPVPDEVAVVLLGPVAVTDGVIVLPGSVTAPYGLVRAIPARPEVPVPATLEVCAAAVCASAAAIKSRMYVVLTTKPSGVLPKDAALLGSLIS